MVGIIDGLGGEEVNQDSNVQTEYAYASDVSGALVQGTQVTGQTGSIADLRAEALATADGTVEPSEMGASNGAWIQAGSNALGAGSEVWVAFETSFGTGPQAVLANGNAVDAVVSTGSFSTGSFFAWGLNASEAFSWLAVGLR